MRLTNYLKLLNEGWTVMSRYKVRDAYEFRWAGGNDAILYIWFKNSKNLYWKVENRQAVYKNNKRITIKTKINRKDSEHEDLYTAAAELGDRGLEGSTVAHGIIVKNKIYPYEDEEGKLTTGALRAIYDYIDDTWWTKK